MDKFKVFHDFISKSSKHPPTGGGPTETPVVDRESNKHFNVYLIYCGELMDVIHRWLVILFTCEDLFFLVCAIRRKWDTERMQMQSLVRIQQPV